MGNSHSSNRPRYFNNEENNNRNDINDPDGGELPVEYFYEYRERDRDNLDRTILLEIHCESFGNIRHQVKATTTLKEVKEIINKDIPLDSGNFILEVDKRKNYDDQKTVNDFLFENCDVVMITIHDISPKFKIEFDTTDIKDQINTLQSDSLEFRPFDKLKKVYKKVSNILNISTYRYTLKFNETAIPFTDESQLDKNFIDLNLTDGSASIKIENLHLPPKNENDFIVTIRFYGKKEKFNASRNNIVDDVIFIDILSLADKDRLYFVVQGKGCVLKRDKTFREQGITSDCTIDAIIKLHDKK